MTDDEYLRRNLMVAKSIGIVANATAGTARLRALSRPSKWMIELLEGIVERAIPLPHELAAYRDADDTIRASQTIKLADGRYSVILRKEKNDD